jgi:hypothetical protein
MPTSLISIGAADAKDGTAATAMAMAISDFLKLHLGT